MSGFTEYVGCRGDENPALQDLPFPVSALEANLDAVGDVLERRLPELTQLIVDRIRAEVVDLHGLDGPQLADTLHQNCKAALQGELHAMRSGREVPSSCPADTAEAARLAAMARLPATVVLQTQRIGHSVVWDAFIAAVEGLGVPAGARRDVLEAGSRFLFEYADKLARFLEQEHARELGRRHSGSREERVRQVLDLLEGRANGSSGLGYELAGLHLGLVGEGKGALAWVEQAAQQLQARALAVQPAGDVVWAWLGRHEALSQTEHRTLMRYQPVDALVAFGEPGEGLEGFRQTHRQALETHGVARRHALTITRYRDVVLESFALRDERLARQLVEIELGPLGEGDRATTLRKTLRAYFACAQNVAASAAALGVHEQTVSNRIRAIEELIGQPVNSRRAELETALRIEPLL